MEPRGSRKSEHFIHPLFCSPSSQMPRWLSSNKMEIVKGILAGVHFICAAHTLCSLANASPPPLLADDPAMLLRESMGLASDGTHKAFPAITVDAFFSRQRIGDIRRHCDFTSPFNTNNILVAVDPSGGGASQFAVCSAIQLPNGTVVVLGLDLLRTKVCPSPPTPLTHAANSQDDLLDTIRKAWQRP